ncbi:MAG: ATP-grasp domain-containing protein [Candidatus Omnitrophota bacterium]
MKKKIVGLTYDVKSQYRSKKTDPEDIVAEFDQDSTIEQVNNAIASGGHEVIKIGNAQNLLRNLDILQKVDIVFNISEGLIGRNRESQVPVILEAMNVPFVGSDGLTLALTLDKILTKKVISYTGLPTPRFFEATTAGSLNGLPFDFPMMVKPRYEGSSKGVSDKSRVENRDRLIEQIRFVNEVYKQSALVEEFISGYEFTVPIIGNDPPLVLEIVQTEIDGKLKLGDLIYTYDRIHSDKVKYVCPAKIDKELEGHLKKMALVTYKAVECRDFGRVDFRVDEKGNPYVLEINPLPSLSVEDVFRFEAELMGETYNQMVNRILDYALERYNLKKSGE